MNVCDVATLVDRVLNRGNSVVASALKVSRRTRALIGL